MTIVSRASTNEYRTNWENIFGTKEIIKEKSELLEDELENIEDQIANDLFLNSNVHEILLKTYRWVGEKNHSKLLNHKLFQKWFELHIFR